MTLKVFGVILYKLKKGNQTGPYKVQIKFPNKGTLMAKSNN